jgi:hypothetical protein
MVYLGKFSFVGFPVGALAALSLSNPERLTVKISSSSPILRIEEESEIRVAAVGSHDP